MFEVLCERCWHTEPLKGDERPDYGCPACRAEDAWVGPFAQAPERFARKETWLVLTSPLYTYAGQADRRARDR